MSPRKVLVPLLMAAAGLALAATTAAAGDKVGPNQKFAGVVNGSAADANVYVVCPGPASQGHPRPGQGVQVIENTGSGFTGSAANRIVFTFGSNVTNQGLLVFTEYGVTQDIPTTIFLPCFGKGTAVFTPQPGSSTSRSSTVTVTFVNVAV